MSHGAPVEMTIGPLAKAGGVGVETVRYYQRCGLIPTPARRGGFRQYGPEALERLQGIRRAQQAGFSLAEIAVLLKLASTGYRMARYYVGRREYGEKGPPHPFMRYLVAPATGRSASTPAPARTT